MAANVMVHETIPEKSPITQANYQFGGFANKRCSAHAPSLEGGTGGTPTGTQ